MSSLRVRCAGKFVWLDYTEYAEELLRESAPWLDLDALVGWLRTARSLVGSEVIAIPVAEVVDTWLAARPELRTSMSRGSRTLYPLRSLLADDDLRAHLAALLSTVRAAFDSTVLAMVVPTPRRWVQLAYGKAFPGPEASVDLDTAESACVYVADFVRVFAQSKLDVLLLAEGAGPAPCDVAEIERYAPLVNIAGHYRWELGLTSSGRPPELPEELRPDFWIAPVPASEVITGVMVPEGFWNGGPAPAEPGQGFRFARIPVGHRPEHVLDRLIQLQ